MVRWLSRTEKVPLGLGWRMGCGCEGRGRIVSRLLGHESLRQYPWSSRGAPQMAHGASAFSITAGCFAGAKSRHNPRRGQESGALSVERSAGAGIPTRIWLASARSEALLFLMRRARGPRVASGLVAGKEGSSPAQRMANS